uniref:TolB family protein n=1 Tax=Fulvivirga sp. TaxID=1931237 RepID=UPI004049AE1B
MKFIYMVVCSFVFLPIYESHQETVAQEVHAGADFRRANGELKILFARRFSEDNRKSIYVINPDGSNEKVFIPFKSGHGEYNPSISPDGSAVVFNTYRYGGWKLGIYDLDDKTVTRISPSSEYYTNGVFSPDGKKITYERNVGRSTHIFIADVDGSNEKILSDKMGIDNRIPSWTPDGGAVVFYSEKENNQDIYKVDIQSGAIQNLTNNPKGNDFGPSVSPDGKKVVFLSDRNGYLDVYTMDVSGNNQKLLTASLQNENNKYNYYKDYNQYWMFKVAWSPDGESLLFSNIVSDNIDLFTMKKDGSSIRQITHTPMSELTPTWGLLNQN